MKFYVDTSVWGGHEDEENENDFQAVDFMRKVREELSNLYNTDKKRYFEEIKKAMQEFKARQEKAYR